MKALGDINLFFSDVLLSSPVKSPVPGAYKNRCPILVTDPRETDPSDRRRLSTPVTGPGDQPALQISASRRASSRFVTRGSCLPCLRSSGTCRACACHQMHADAAHRSCHGHLGGDLMTFQLPAGTDARAVWAAHGKHPQREQWSEVGHTCDHGRMHILLQFTTAAGQRLLATRNRPKPAARWNIIDSWRSACGIGRSLNGASIPCLLKPRDQPQRV